MQESHFEPQHNATHSTLKQAQELLTSLYMPAISEIPQNAQSKVITGEHYSVEYFVEPTPQGERLLWARVNVPAPFSDSCAFLSLSPFPQGEAAESILSLLNRAHLAGAKAEQIFPELEALGKEATGMGWIPLVNLPLPKRMNLLPLSYIAPSLEEIMRNDPSKGHTYVTTLNTNGVYELCTAKLHPHSESALFSFYRSENDEELKLIREIDLPLSSLARSGILRPGASTTKNLLLAALRFQQIFHFAGAEYTSGRMERAMIEEIAAQPSPSNLSQDDRLRLMTSLVPPFELSHTFASGAKMALESGTEAVSVMIKATPSPTASTYISLLDRAGLKLSDAEWDTRRREFISAVKRLASESEGLQPKALEQIVSLGTKQLRFGAKLKDTLGYEAKNMLDVLTDNYDLNIRTDLGNSPSEIRRICDGSEIVVISKRPTSLGSENLAIFNNLILELKPNGAIDFTAHNLSGNQVTGRVSAAGVARAGGTAQLAVTLATVFAQQTQQQDFTTLQKMLDAAASLDPMESFVIADGQSPYLDLPPLQDAHGRAAFAIAEVCARQVCQTAEGHGKHQAAAVGTGVAEARFQFPAAPYSLTLQISNRAFVQADFAPTKNAPSNNAPRYTFAGEVAPPALDFSDLEALLRNFAEWGRDHSQRRAEAQPLEQTIAFRILKRMLPTELHTQ